MAIVGAGPGGLECALTLAGRREVVLFDAREAIGGQLAVAGAAPNRGGWRALVDFYAARARRASSCGWERRRRADDLAGFDEVVIAIGSTESPAGAARDRARAAVVARRSAGA